MSSRAVVAIFNSNDDIVEMLRLAIEQAGLIVVSGHTTPFATAGSTWPTSSRSTTRQ